MQINILSTAQTTKLACHIATLAHTQYTPVQRSALYDFWVDTVCTNLVKHIETPRRKCSEGYTPLGTPRTCASHMRERVDRQNPVPVLHATNGSQVDLVMDWALTWSVLHVVSPHVVLLCMDWAQKFLFFLTKDCWLLWVLRQSTLPDLFGWILGSFPDLFIFVVEVIAASGRPYPATTCLTCTEGVFITPRRRRWMAAAPKNLATIASTTWIQMSIMTNGHVDYGLRKIHSKWN